LAELAQQDPRAAGVLVGRGPLIQELAQQSPGFHRALIGELHTIGHRGPAEVEMRSSVFADDPELLARMIARTLQGTDRPTSQPADVPLRAKLIADFGARQLRDREIRRDRMVRAIWILRELLREYGLRLVDAGELTLVDDVFYLLVDELDAPPAAMREVVTRRREEQHSLTKLVPPEAFSGRWDPEKPDTALLRAGESLSGLGVCHGRAKGRVRVITSGSIDAVQPGEVLVAKVTDVGYTAVFGYTAAVITELGGPLSHAAIVAREYAVPCVVNARAATSRLRPGSLVEVDGSTGEITVLDG
jgi:phosphohistidine swiveling domain-containing protein